MKPELLSPAGSYESLLAAARNGADAVYLGAKTLNARQGAGNFDKGELIRAADYLHERGKKLYVTVNTLVKQSELALVSDIAEQLCAARVDAAIVQDMGVSGLLSQMLPSLKLHASTQMAVTNAQGASYLRDRGFERVVLAREMSLNEIRACADTGVQTEVFCHGALCVSCSGQCLFSGMVGGRSGNRGMCAQPCRLEYRLSGGANASGHLLSPKDLLTADRLKDFETAGVSSLKIEGRLKRPEYVAIVTNIYRRLLDGESYNEALDEALKQIFNRGGFTHGYAWGISDGKFLSVKRPSHWGVKVGESADGRRIDLSKNVLSGDALAIRSGVKGDEPVRVSGEAGKSVPNPVKAAGEVFRLVSCEQMRTAQESYAEEKQLIPISAELLLEIGLPAKLTVSDGALSFTAKGAITEPSLKGETDLKRIEDQLRKTGGTAYAIKDVKITANEGVYLPISEINRLRRECVDGLARLRTEYNSPKLELHGCAEYTKPQMQNGQKPYIAVQSSDIKLLRELIKLEADDAIYEPTDLRAGALEREDVTDLYLYVPPVIETKTLEEINRFALKHGEIKGVYLSNISHMGLNWNGEIRYDFALNLTNEPALSYLGIESDIFAPSVELTNRESAMMGGRREQIVYGRVPLMRLKHCPLNAARGGGKHIQCRACDAAPSGKRLNDSYLTDRMNAVFPLRRLATDDGCIITLLNSVPLNLGSRLNELKPCVGFRLIFTDETPEEATKLLYAFIRENEGATASKPSGKYTTGHYFRKTE